jgi:hypothetical protein
VKGQRASGVKVRGSGVVLAGSDVTVVRASNEGGERTHYQPRYQ